MQLTLGFSPCPNDTFMFDALVNKKMDTREFDFVSIIEDVEQLNRKTLDQGLDISKISYANYPNIADNYLILSSGSAMGINNGPLIISKKKIYPDEIRDVRLAIPGKHTTANLLVSMAHPEAENKKEYLFSDIEEAILSDKADAGVIIHETRFTYQNKGLRKVQDLGKFWHKITGSPLPLGGIVINRKLGQDTQRTVELLIQQSVEYAFQNPSSSAGFIKRYASELDDAVMNRHISLYVNEYSVDMGKEGRSAIQRLFLEGSKAGFFSMPEMPIFVTET